MTTDISLSDQPANPTTAAAAAADGTLCIEHCGVTMSLRPERCIYMPAADRLILSDVHLGKEAVFQRHGLGIPDGITSADIERIARLIERLQPRELLILGDLVHALPQSQESWLPAFAHLVEEHPKTEFHVITGNHDKPGTHNLLPASVQWHEEIREATLHFTHYPRDDTDSTNTSDSSLRFAGHIHPSYVLKVRGRKNTLRMPAYWLSQNQIVLPAFGEFTGTHNIKPAPGDKIYGIGPDTVISMPVATPKPVAAADVTTDTKAETD